MTRTNIPCHQEYWLHELAPNPDKIPISWSYDYRELYKQIVNATVLYFEQIKLFLRLFLFIFPIFVILSIINITDNGDNKISKEISKLFILEFIADISSVANSSS